MGKWNFLSDITYNSVLNFKFIAVNNMKYVPDIYHKNDKVSSQEARRLEVYL